MSIDGNSTSFKDLVTRAWLGMLPLWQIFWLGLVLISFAIVGLFRFVVVDVLFVLSVEDSLLLFFLLVLPILSFLWMAVWRSAAYGKPLARYVARVIVALHTIFFTYMFVRYLAVYQALG